MNKKITILLIIGIGVCLFVFSPTAEAKTQPKRQNQYPSQDSIVPILNTPIYKNKTPISSATSKSSKITSPIIINQNSIKLTLLSGNTLFKYNSITLSNIKSYSNLMSKYSHLYTLQNYNLGKTTLPQLAKFPKSSFNFAPRMESIVNRNYNLTYNLSNRYNNIMSISIKKIHSNINADFRKLSRMKLLKEVSLRDPNGTLKKSLHSGHADNRGYIKQENRRTSTSTLRNVLSIEKTGRNSIKLPKINGINPRFPTFPITTQKSRRNIPLNDIPIETPLLPSLPYQPNTAKNTPNSSPNTATTSGGGVGYAGIDSGIIHQTLKLGISEYALGFNHTEETLKEVFGIGTSQNNRASPV